MSKVFNHKDKPHVEKHVFHGGIWIITAEVNSLLCHTWEKHKNTFQEQLCFEETEATKLLSCFLISTQILTWLHSCTVFQHICLVSKFTVSCLLSYMKLCSTDKQDSWARKMKFNQPDIRTKLPYTSSGDRNPFMSPACQLCLKEVSYALGGIGVLRQWDRCQRWESIEIYPSVSGQGWCWEFVSCALWFIRLQRDGVIFCGDRVVKPHYVSLQMCSEDPSMLIISQTSTHTSKWLKVSQYTMKSMSSVM